jgi:hypothetical protein
MPHSIWFAGRTPTLFQFLHNRNALSLRGTYVPQFHVAVCARRGQGIAVGAPRHGHHIAFMSLEDCQLFSRCRVPQLYRFVIASRREDLAVEAPRIDRSDPRMRDSPDSPRY